MRRLTATEWIIHDHWFPPNDPRRTVACMHEVAAGNVDVVWLRELWLPNRYASVGEALDDVRQTLTTVSKPIPIAHRRPYPGDMTRAG